MYGRPAGPTNQLACQIFQKWEPRSNQTARRPHMHALHIELCIISEYDRLSYICILIEILI